MNIIETLLKEHPELEQYIISTTSRHIYVPCPKCREDGGDTSGDNLVITPAKNIAKCFACGYTLLPGQNNSLRKKTIEALRASTSAMEYLKSRKVEEAALQCGLVGFLTDEIKEELKIKETRQALIFWRTNGYRLRFLAGQPKAKESQGSKPGWEIYTGADKWIVAEGEFDVLSLYSALGSKFNYFATCGAGNKFPYKDVKVLYLVPDQDKAGQMWVENHKQEFHCYIVKTSFHDANEWHQRDVYFSDHLKEELSRATFYARPVEEVRRQVEDKLEREKGNSRTKRRQVAQIILDDMLLRGKFIESWGQLYYYDNENRIVIPVHDKSRDWQAMLGTYGVYHGETAASITYQHIVAEVISRGLAEEVDLKTVSWYSERENKLYIDLKNGTMLEVSHKEMNIIPYGKPIMFYRNHRRTKELCIDFNTQGEDYLLNLIELFPLVDETGKKLLYCWILGVIFNGLIETKPLLVIESVAGSGKTTLAKTIGQVIVGQEFDVSALPESVDSFMAVLARNALVVFDNAEKISNEMLDHIAMAATGATFQKRKLYHEFDIVTAKTNAWVMFTMMNNTLRRKDIVERSLIVRMRRLQKFEAQRTLRDLISNELVWGSILQTAQQILEEIHKKGYIPECSKIKQVRMADFAVFVDIVSRIKGWNIEDITTWWLKHSAKTALEDNLYAMVFLKAIDSIAGWNRNLQAQDIIHQMHALANNDVPGMKLNIAKREKEIILSTKPKRFWKWLETQQDNFQAIGYVLEFGEMRNRRTVKVVKTEDAIDIEAITESGEVPLYDSENAPF